MYPYYIESTRLKEALSIHKLSKPKLLTFALTICLLYSFVIHPKSYPLEKALATGDVVLAASGTYNEENLLQFIHSISQKKNDQIKVTAYSKEGYPAIYDVRYESGNIICTIDNTRNLYGRDLFKRTEIFESIQTNSNKDVFLVSKAGKKLWLFQFQN